MIRIKSDDKQVDQDTNVPHQNYTHQIINDPHRNWYLTNSSDVKTTKKGDQSPTSKSKQTKIGRSKIRIGIRNDKSY